MKLCLYTVIAITLLLSSVFEVKAQTLCGNIIIPADVSSGQSEDDITPIQDCNNPFNADEAVNFTYKVQLNDTEMQNGGVLSLPTSTTTTVAGHFSYEYPDAYGGGYVQLFKKVGTDYRLAEASGAGEFTWNNVEPGEYVGTVVFNFYPVLNDSGILERLFAWVIPRAIAYNEDYLEVAQFAFTITVPPPPKTGASSVLFLPGIQGSRLYKSGILGTEDQLWEPTTNQDVRQLALTTTGFSVNDIYTRDVVDEVVLPTIGGNIYKGFISYFEDLKSANVINDFQPFAYDWRFAVTDIVYSGTQYKDEVRGVIDELEALAESSFSGKVTIVAHSNGGLLAKTMIIELERLGKASLVDKVIFIGTPHLGTPKAIGTVLHGYDQQKLGGALIDDETAREVINNMPGAYALLPSEKYLQTATKPLITIADSSVTATMRSRYGAAVDTLTEYTDFLNGAEGRTNVYDNISAPYVTNQAILSDALASHRTQLDNWVPPANIAVHNIVGVGLKTINALEYREFTERTVCTSNLLGQITCNTPERYLRPYAHFTQYGDETVTGLSAEGVVGKTYYFNLDSYNRDLLNPLSSYDHADFTEIKQIQELIRSIVASTSDQVDYVSAQRPTFTREYAVTTIDSPVRIVATDDAGNRTGVIQVNGQDEVIQEIPGSEYIEFAGAKYLITPRTSSITTTLYGEAYGSYTLTTATLKQNDTQVVETRLSDATTTPQMVAEFTSLNGSSSGLKTDINGDGTFETETTLNGVMIQKPLVTFATLRQEIRSLQLPRLRETALLVLVDVAAAAAQKPGNKKLVAVVQETLRSVGRLVTQYENKRWISSAQAQSLQNTITVLRATIK